MAATALSTALPGRCALSLILNGETCLANEFIDNYYADVLCTAANEGNTLLAPCCIPSAEKRSRPWAYTSGNKQTEPFACLSRLAHGDWLHERAVCRLGNAGSVCLIAELAL